jgi:hypothetical protein
MTDYLRPSISNGNRQEQAMIRKWWYEQHDARGCMAWGYCLHGLYADNIWFPNEPFTGKEEPGQQTGKRFPLEGKEVMLCEAKMILSPELIGQALVYSWYIKQEGAMLRETMLKCFRIPKRDSRRVRTEGRACSSIMRMTVAPTKFMFLQLRPITSATKQQSYSTCKQFYFCIF